VWVGSYGTFTKRGGGTIDATNSAKYGKIIFVRDSPDNRGRNKAAGPSVNLDSRKSGSGSGWEYIK
jgi:hypothetical protein